MGAAFGRGQSSVAIRTAEREAFVLVTTDIVKFAEDEMEAPGWTQRYVHVKAVKCCQDNSEAVCYNFLCDVVRGSQIAVVIYQD